ncbi:antibiotic biosynthesis monooxygenase [Frankia sp. QA3]|uniref:antibiotic biosynthesis monooxygenase family protein n=1 Tax=Frankia sp. QA3 TaxID=710111 RepID=UPI000269BB07|nr:antibiotic biosynthesis monooxygenase [Frankia sp. QA3]EIV91134.1 putative enzyme involved in biosynthesis of extracellular polysaccharides [Frankia sp. QA3]
MGAGVEAAVRVMLWAVDPPDDPGAVERAYHAISSKLVGTPGLLGNTLQRSAADSSRYVVVSVWSGMTEFSAWEQGADHRGTTSPLRPLQDPERRPVIYTEVAAYGPQGSFGEAPAA